MTRDTRGQRGKTAEKMVEEWLGDLNKKIARFAWIRFPDARMARGRMPAMPSDYLVGSPRGTTFLEVKQTEHDFRIPKAAISQLSELKKWKLAGCRAALLFYFSNLQKWRCMDAGEMETLEKGSWDLRGESLFDTAEQAFYSKYKWD